VKLPDLQTIKDIAIQFVMTAILVTIFWFLWNLMP
jgi:hypothetical protein